MATRPVDFREQADGLAAIVQAELGADPFCGAVYVFRSCCGGTELASV
jgi:transposase